MLTAETKRHIDAARQVLVGVVPNPAAQIDQITNALIYKSMDDMDQQAILQGDKPHFFVGELENYSWRRLMDSRLGNQARMNLYAEALLKFREAKKFPELFHDIFREAYLPFRSPDVLYLFLKEIDYLNYSHSEELGNAYEYLLSILSAQGDAGQFRTPRHIIDFIVDVVDPDVGDTILDPACGTGGFLISAYKHIQEKYTEVDKKTGKTKSTLTPDQRRKLMASFQGYDIDSQMAKLSRVNMYLHNFKKPRIYEYDTLTREERWKDSFSVILANPPFMSPKGGIMPNPKFGIKSSRSEVLFVQYFIDHLKQNNGRAGMIVPEGIIFQSGSAHRQIRENLIKDGLYAVVSLPAGVFNPYSGVKTSILFFDNAVVKKTKKILFVRIENDGYSLGAQRRPSDKDDLPDALNVLRAWKDHILKGSQMLESPSAVAIDRDEISQNEDLNLSAERYATAVDYSSLKWPRVKLGDETLFSIESGGTPKSEEPKYWNGDISWVTLVDLPADNLITRVNQTTRKITAQGLKESSAKLLPRGTVLVSSRATIGRIGIAEIELATNQGFKNIVIKDTNLVVPEFIAYVMSHMTSQLESLAQGGTFKEVSKRSFSTVEVPLPPISYQKELVVQLDTYRQIIDGARKIVSNWKPIIVRDSSWSKIKLKDTAAVDWGNTNLTKSAYTPDGKYLGVSAAGADGRMDYAEHKVGVTVISAIGANCGRVFFPEEPFTAIKNTITLTPNEKIDPKFLFFIMEQNKLPHRGGGQPFISKGDTQEYEIPLPPIQEQRNIAERIENEKKFVDGNKKLIEIYERKISDLILSILK